MSIIYIKVLQKENLLDFEVLTFVIHIFPTSTFHVPAAYSLFKMMNKSANGRPRADRVILIFEKGDKSQDTAYNHTNICDLIE